tara:strand:+ start:142 stop:636 length:495 start_codon:yes stop_codon:yes gene_type:complete
MNNIVSHRPHMDGSYPLGVNDLQPGMIVEFTYKKDSVGQPTVKRYTVMIVDPRFRRPQDKEDFTHAINLDIAPRNAIVELAKKTGSTIANSNLQYRKVFAEKLIVEGEPRQFYQKTIAGLIQGSGKGSYRTFKTQRIQNLVLYNYLFPEHINHYDPSELDENEN